MTGYIIVGATCFVAGALGSAAWDRVSDWWRRRELSYRDTCVKECNLARS